MTKKQANPTLELYIKDHKPSKNDKIMGFLIESEVSSFIKKINLIGHKVVGVTIDPETEQLSVIVEQKTI